MTTTLKPVKKVMASAIRTAKITWLRELWANGALRNNQRGLEGAPDWLALRGAGLESAAFNSNSINPDMKLQPKQWEFDWKHIYLYVETHSNTTHTFPCASFFMEQYITQPLNRTRTIPTNPWPQPQPKARFKPRQNVLIPPKMS